MTSKHYPEFNDILEQEHYAPSISLIFPFNTKLGLGEEIHHKLKTKVIEVERLLAEKYPADQINNLLVRFRHLVDQFQSEKGHLGIALFLSPVFEKIVYLDFEPQEKLIIDDNFEIRDLLINKNKLNKLILLLLSGNEIRYYLADRGVVTRLKVDVSDQIETFMANTLHDVSIYYEKTDRKDKAMHVFLRNADEGLNLVLKDYPYPVVVAGVEKMLSHFKLVTKHTELIKDYIGGNYLESIPSELSQLVQSSIENIQNRKEEHLIILVEEALNKNMLARGITEVWKQATEKNGHLLVVEHNFRSVAGQGSEPDSIFTLALDKVPFPIQDVVDDIIEKVILNGGKVEFVRDGKLGKYSRVALITHYRWN